MTLSEAEAKLRKANALAIKVEGEMRDLSSLKDLGDDRVIEPVAFDSPEGRDIYRHSASHIMAHAVKELFPGAKFAIGPSTEEGFYYDFDIESPLTPEDLARIEEKMAGIIRGNTPFTRKALKRSDAIALFRGLGEEYKVALLEEIADDEV
ncbi:MAG TPA: threonine--tRNA ligase, partial [Thermodesulfovibrionales bacterium]|nr:threonine--tRNA ligase [Thermodesulfovibrionales bacterium]